MKQPIRIALALFALTLIGAPGRAAGEAVATTTAEAAGIGAWTTDYSAAVKVAAERHLPLFIQFTGSDWCGWCQKMEKEGLSKPEFLAAMATRCVLVSIDFPHKTELPAALKEQNPKVADLYKKRGGFPAYYIVDSDAKTVHWSFGAHPKYGADLKLLVSDIEGFCAGCSCMIEHIAKDLPPAKAEAYRKAAGEYAAKQQVVAAWLEEKHPDGAAAKSQFEGFLAELKTLKAAMDTQAGSQSASAETR